MKKLSLKISVFLMGIASILSAQSIETSTYMEWTKISPKIGTSVMVVFDNGIEVGGFYQQTTIDMKSEKNYVFGYEEELFGFQVGCPVYEKERVQLKLNVRVGASNRENFAILPSMVGQLKMTKWVTAFAGVGTRNFTPTAISGLKFKI